MFYIARWYDPSLGRFAQADSIVPAGVQGLDRYAYVNNSPLRYIDPSGHSVATPCINMCPGESDSGRSNPDAINSQDPVALTQGEYSGTNMYNLYLFYFQQPGWWHSPSFDPDGRFAIYDFLVLMVFFEMSGIGDKDPSAQNAYSEATADNISFWCADGSGGSCSGLSNNGILNYLSGREVARNRYDSYQKYLMTGNLKDAGLGPIRNGVPFLDNEHSPSVARTVVTNAVSMMSPQGSLMDYGNQSMFPESVWQALSAAPTGCRDVTCVYWRSADNLAYVMTQGQIDCWEFGKNC